jgi:16S rRNA C967 or C1407 C5-methylase (RsmB/RsmF family)
MGKKKFLKRKDRKMLDQSNKESQDKQPRGEYKDIIKGNPSFEKYYKAQNLCSEADFAKFMETLLEELPAAFRITSCRGQEKGILKYNLFPQKNRPL